MVTRPRMLPVAMAMGRYAARHFARPVCMSTPIVPSPCIDVCTLDPRSGWCAGCLRTLDEIAAWGALNDRQKREVWKRLPQRRVEFEATKTEGP